MSTEKKAGRTMDPTIKALAAVKREIPKIILGAPEDARLLVIDMAQAELQRLHADALRAKQQKMGLHAPNPARDEQRQFGTVQP